MTVPMIKVLVVDDSAFMRKILADTLEEEDDITVVGRASDGKDALQKIARIHPDIVTLDVCMPEMDGIECLKKIMADHPLPVIMVSAVTVEGADETIQSLELGAVDFIPKTDMEKLKDEVKTKIRMAARSRVPKTGKPATPKIEPSFRERFQVSTETDTVIAIASSTGGPPALSKVIPTLPADLPAAVLITQHMPPKFTEALANRLAKLGTIPVKEGVEGEEVKEGQAYIAPGDYHMEIRREGRKKFIALNHGPQVQSVRPSADVMMRSIAEVYGKNVIGVVLTGMGADGADGIAAIKEAGGRCIAQNEDTCVVYGMPKAVVDRGLADTVKPIEDIASTITHMLAKTT